MISLLKKMTKFSILYRMITIDTDESIRLRLKNLLITSKINHKTEIMKEENLKKAHIYCKTNNLSGQVTGPLLENYIKIKCGMIKNKLSACVGDCNWDNTNIEIKVSTGGKDHNKFNYVQIRMNHDCDYLLTAYYIDNDNVEDLGELFIFKVSKNDMKEMILKYGGYGHGTVEKLGPITKADLDNIKNNKEYAIRPKYGDKCWNEFLKFKFCI